MSANQRRAPDAVSRGKDFDSPRHKHAKAIVEEAIMMSIEAKPSDSCMVNLLYSFRAQADALGALGVFDDDTTDLGAMLHKETGGHDALMKHIDAHIAMEREKEAQNALLRPKMNAYMRAGALYPEALPYALFPDNKKLHELENRCTKVEIEVRQELEKVIDDAWNDKNAYARIQEVVLYQLDRLKTAEVQLMKGVVDVVDDQFIKTDPTGTPLGEVPKIGEWSLITDDPRYHSLAKAHKKELSLKRKHGDSSYRPGSLASMKVGSNVYGTLPPLPSVTGTSFENRQRKMAALQRLFRDSDNRRVLAGQDFVNNTGGVCDYVSGFAKYASMWTLDNPLQATLTAIPIAMGIASAAGVATITAPWYLTAFVGCETLRGIRKRSLRGESLVPPTIQRIRNALTPEDDNSKWLLGVAGTLGGSLTYSLGNAASTEWKLLHAILRHQRQDALGVSWIFGGYATDPDTVVSIAQEAREMAQRFALNPADRAAGAFLDTKDTFIKKFAQSSWDLIGGEWVRDGVDYAWKRGNMIVDLAGPLVLIGSTVYKAVSFMRDGYRPDRARLYLYCNDPENAVQKPLLEKQELAREVLPILYGDKKDAEAAGNNGYRGDKEATWQPLPYPTIKEWMPELTDATKETQKMTTEWKGWYANQLDWDDKSTDEVINKAKQVHLWKEPIVRMDRILTQKFVLTDPMLEGMKTLKENWAEWSETWEIIDRCAHTEAGLRSVNWLAGPVNDLSRMWFKLYSVLAYQHAYITGGIDPSTPRGGPEKKFDARATVGNRPSFVTMIDEIKSIAGAAKRQSELQHSAERASVKLRTFDGPRTLKLEQLFDKYYPGFADLALAEATKKKKKKEKREEDARRAAEAAGQPLQQPRAPTPPLEADDIQEFLRQLNVPNPGAQPDAGDGPIIDDFPLGPLQPVPMAGVGSQASVVDEVYARVSALRL
jgi:hypothetical protein